MKKTARHYSRFSSLFYLYAKAFNAEIQEEDFIQTLCQDKDLFPLGPYVPLYLELVRGVDCHQKDLDKIIEGKLSKNWKLERLLPIKRSILRLAIFEISFKPDIPVPVIINEYIEIAKTLLLPHEVGFINGILDALGKEIR